MLSSFTSGENVPAINFQSTTNTIRKSKTERTNQHCNS